MARRTTTKKVASKRTQRTAIKVASPSDYPNIDFGAIARESDAEWTKRKRGKAGQSEAVSDSEAAKLDQMIDEALSSVTIRFQPGLIRDFKLFAREDGLKYQSLMRSVLTKYAATRKRKNVPTR